MRIMGASLSSPVTGWFDQQQEAAQHQVAHLAFAPGQRLVRAQHLGDELADPVHRPGFAQPVVERIGILDRLRSLTQKVPRNASSMTRIESRVTPTGVGSLTTTFTASLGPAFLTTKV